MSNQTLLAATDGGATSTSATFGWTLRDSTHELISCFGPVHGHQPTAFRAEATSLLSFLSLLHSLLTNYHWLPLHRLTPLPVYLDNQALLTIIQHSSSNAHHSPSTTTTSEFDVLLQIFTVLNYLPLNICFHHVKSHQDARAQISTLALPAQANCRADHLATHARSHCESHPCALLYPAAQCSLQLAESTITRSHKQALYHHAFASVLREHILQSRSWKSTDKIDWDFFSAFCIKQTRSLQFLLKWIHRLLPIGAVLHRRQASSSPFCPACGHLETYLHFLVCNHSSRIPLHRQLISNLRKCLSTISTDPNLKTILLEGINQHFSPNEPLFPPASSKYHRLVQSQSDLGWDNLLRGSISTEWMILHLQYLRTLPTSSTPISCHPLLPVLSLLLSDIQGIWNYRCCQRHAKDRLHHDSELLQQAKQQLTELYQYRNTVLPNDRHIFKTSLRIHLQDDLLSISAWLHNHSHYIRQSHQTAQHLNLSNTMTLTNYFHPA